MGGVNFGVGEPVAVPTLIVLGENRSIERFPRRSAGASAR